MLEFLNSVAFFGIEKEREEDEENREKSLRRVSFRDKVSSRISRQNGRKKAGRTIGKGERKRMKEKKHELNFGLRVLLVELDDNGVLAGKMKDDGIEQDCESDKLISTRRFLKEYRQRKRHNAKEVGLKS